MNSKVESKEFRFDFLKWLLAIALVVGAAVANSMYANQYEVIYRTLGVLVVIAVAVLFAVNTAKGNAFWNLLKAAQVEVRKVVWPSRQETTQTTLLVLVVVLITALILWGLDSLIGKLASLVLG